MIVANRLRYRQHLIVLKVFFREVRTIIRVLCRTNQTIDNHLTLHCSSIHICLDDIRNELLCHTVNRFIDSIRRILNQMHDVVQRTSQLVILDINREQSIIADVCKVDIAVILLNQLDAFLSRIKFIHCGAGDFVCFSGCSINHKERTFEESVKHKVTIHLIHMRQVFRIDIDDIILATIIVNEVIVFLYEDVSTQDFEVFIECFIELDNITDGGKQMLNRKDVLIDNLTDFFTSECAQTIRNIIVQNRIATKALGTDAVL